MPVALCMRAAKALSSHHTVSGLCMPTRSTKIAMAGSSSFQSSYRNYTVIGKVLNMYNRVNCIYENLHELCKEFIFCTFLVNKTSA